MKECVFLNGDKVYKTCRRDSMCEKLEIPLERKQEIDSILRKTERKIKHGRIHSISFEEFKRNQYKKRRNRGTSSNERHTCSNN